MQTILTSIPGETGWDEKWRYALHQAFIDGDTTLWVFDVRPRRLD